MLQALEKYDSWQTRRHWAADSFQGLPPPDEKVRLRGSLWVWVWAGV